MNFFRFVTRFIVYLIFSISFAVLGGFIFEGYQRIPIGDWEMIFSSDFSNYGLDSKPVRVLDVNWESHLILTEKQTIFECERDEAQECTVFYGDELENTGRFLRTNEVSRFETPSFNYEVEDITKMGIGLHETALYAYYLTSKDGSIWYWAWDDNFYSDVFGWGLSGFFGFVLGGFVMRASSKKLAPKTKIENGK